MDRLLHTWRKITRKNNTSQHQQLLDEPVTSTNDFLAEARAAANLHPVTGKKKTFSDRHATLVQGMRSSQQNGLPVEYYAPAVAPGPAVQTQLHRVVEFYAPGSREE